MMEQAGSGCDTPGWELDTRLAAANLLADDATCNAVYRRASEISHVQPSRPPLLAITHNM
jgi:hypothetical protein